MKSKHPIGILDSGIGGLSVLNEIRKTLPNEPIVYFGDSAWCPYGARDAEDIQRRVYAITDFLLSKNCKLIVIACNSATIAAVEALRSAYPVPFVGMEPGIKPAAAHTQTGTVGILATEASLAGEKFHRLVNDHGEGVTIITRPCPNFVKLVEDGDLNSPTARTIVEEEVLPLIEAGADVLVLGCSHYPFLKPLIQDIAGPQVTVMDTGQAVAQRVNHFIAGELEVSQPKCDIYTSGELSHLEKHFPLLCPHIKASLHHADI